MALNNWFDISFLMKEKTRIQELKQKQQQLQNQCQR